MANAIIMPKLGNSVESCIIVDWKKAVGDAIEPGETLCEVETDKAVMEVESTESGTLLALFFDVGDEVPVQTNIAAVGAPGEDYAALDPNGGASAPAGVATAPDEPQASTAQERAVSSAVSSAQPQADADQVSTTSGHQAISPRARNLAQRKGLDIAALAGSGPQGRIIERDVEAALAAAPKLTPVAKAMVSSGAYEAAGTGTGPGGRVTKRDLVAKGDGREETPALASTPTGHSAPAAFSEDEITTIAVKGVRRVIAQRMLASLQTTAQLTLDATADARALLAYRKRLKRSDATLSLEGVTINDLILYAVSRTLPRHPDLNALFEHETIALHKHVHLGVAVDTPRGLMVPTVRDADLLTLRQLAAESKRLATACIEGRVTPDELTGGTFTVTNLGAFGVERFTPVLNPPQVAILGVGNVNLKPVQVGDEVEFVPHIGLSLTINHQVVDGAPAARFLQALAQGIGEIELLLAV